MFTKSIWNASAASTNFPELLQKIHTDTLIIGGGITGISLALKLAQAGCKTILLESRRIGRGTSSHSTGNLYVTIDAILSSLSKKYDVDVVKQVVAARQHALDQMKRYVSEFGLDCDFQTVPWYLYTAEGEAESKINAEWDLGKKAGLDFYHPSFDELPLPATKALALPDQAQINPLKYVLELAKHIPHDYGLIFENSPVMKIEKESDYYKVTTPGGAITAKHVIHATHTPKGIHFVQTLLGPYREYGIACKLNNRMDQKGIFWGYYGDEKYSTRFYELDGQQYLLVIGKPHKVGQGKDNRENLMELEAFARKHFQVETVVYRWGGQHYRPADLLPYIGELDENMYVATGFSTDGLVYGTLSAGIISDLILGNSNPWTELFDPSRTNPLKSASNFLRENFNVAKQYIDLLPGMADDTEFADIAEGDGAVVDKDGHKLAVYRNYDKKLVVKSAICPHMNCVVHFNKAEQTWDCPCHGSRFDTDGFILEGPVLHPLRGIHGEDGKAQLDKKEDPDH